MMYVCDAMYMCVCLLVYAGVLCMYGMHMGGRTNVHTDERCGGPTWSHDSKHHEIKKVITTDPYHSPYY